jgi:O-acetyl-ADP-ribose deacetylase (regulator of RNase III)
MTNYIKGDLLESDADALINTVNCVGVMGRGLALQFKKRFPDNFRFYESACKRSEVKPGKVLVYETGCLCAPKYIINFPTKRHWKDVSRIEDVKLGLEDLVSVVRLRNISSLAIPPLGCGLGGLSWDEVKPCIEEAMSQLVEVQISVYEPGGVASRDMTVRNRTAPNMTPGRAALVALTRRYLNGLLDPFVTLLEIHKLMYFLQECGEPLRLRYVKAPYGPYAENLSHVLNAIEGHLLHGYEDGGDNPNKQIKIVPGAEYEALAFLKNQPQTAERIARVATLVDGFETPFGVELLSTAHWVIKNEGAKGNDIVERVYAWGEQKLKFSPQQIKIAVERLCDLGFAP